MIKISPFTPLYFRHTNDISGWSGNTVQYFATGDVILIEAIADTEDAEPILALHDVDREIGMRLNWSVWQMNPRTKVLFYELRGLLEGTYHVQIGSVDSEEFVVTDDADLLEKTVLFQYSMKDNKQRTDVVAWIAGVQHFFNLRLPGGFKDDGWAFTVENEQFTTQDMDQLDVYSREATQQSFTLGSAEGVPVWYAEKLNKVLCSSYVYIDGVRYGRKDGAVPEMQQTIEGQRSYIFSVLMQRVQYTNPSIEESNQIAMRIALSQDTGNYEPRENADTIVIL